MSSIGPAHTQTVKLEKEGNVYKTDCRVNGLKLKMYIETAADVVTLSTVEASFMLKYGYISPKDIIGEAYYKSADGDINEGTQVILRKIEIGGVVLRDVKATIIHSDDAPVSMGQSALAKLGKITIDYEKNTMTFSGKNLKEKSGSDDADVQEEKPTKKQAIPKYMVHVEGGDFQMGSTFGKPDEEPVHTVVVNNFYLSKYEVTTGQFREFVKATGYKTAAETEDWGASIWNGESWSSRKGVSWECDAFGIKRTPEQDQHPVIFITWRDAVKYCEWLSETTGRHFRLPTEAEWEFAARGGKKSGHYTYAGSNNIEEVGWYLNNGQMQTHPVGQKKPNELGLYDMTGNVLEYTNDWYDPKYYQTMTGDNPRGPEYGKAKVARGGAIRSTPSESRNTDRHYDETWSRCNYNGFRVAMDE